MMRKSSIRVIAALALSGALLLGCGGSQRLRPPSPPNTIESLKLASRKLDNALVATKRMIQRSRGAEYLPALHMRLAELYTEKARYAWLIVYETRQARGEQGRALEVPEARMFKNMAIGEYDRVLREYPSFKRSDEALFLMAHEYRELGDYDNMRQGYERLISTYPKSKHRLEAFLVLGDTDFDKGNLDGAERYYRMVLGETESHVHPLARYKLAWVRVNKEDCKGASVLFEQVLRHNDTPHGSRTIVATQRSFDLRRESLIDLAYCFPEVYGQKPAAPFFRELASSSSDYVAAMRRVANRYYVKEMLPEAAAALRDVLDNAAYDTDTLDTARRLYEVAIKGQVHDQAGATVAILGRVVEAARFDHRVPEATRKKLSDEFEVYARDLATKTHLAAKSANTPQLFAHAADAYTAYLEYFDAAKASLELKQNRAEALVSAGRQWEAGVAFEQVSAALKRPADRLQAWTNSFAAFQRALDVGGLPPRQRVTAWAGLRNVGRNIIAAAPTGDKVVQVKFAIAKSYYDASDYHRASELFYSLARQYPSAAEAAIGAHMAMDSLLLLEDMQGLATVAGRFRDDPRLGDAKFKQEVADIIEKAQQRQVADLVMSGGNRDEKLVALAQEHKGSQLGEQALYNALILARDNGEIDRFYQLGEEFLTTYPKSGNATTVLTALAKAATDRADFSQAARYLEKAVSAEPTAREATERLEAAASIRAYFGSDGAGPVVLDLVGRGSDKVAGLLVLLARSGNFATLEQVLGDTRVDGTVPEFLRGLLAYRRGDAAAAITMLGRVAQGRGNGDLESAMVARARFLVGELALERFTAEQPDTSDLAAAITAKAQKLNEVDRAFAAAIDSGDAEWALAAVVRAGEAYRRFATYLRALPMPAGVGPAEEKQIKEALKAKADEADRRAAELRQQCASRAQKNPVFSETVRSCLTDQTPPASVAVFARVAGRGDTVPPGAAPLRRDLQKKPNDGAKLLQLAELYLGTGDVAMALLIVDRIDEQNLESSESANLRGVALVRAGEPNGAYEAFQRAVTLDGANRVARLNLAAHYAAFGYVARARSELKRAGDEVVVRGDPSEHPELGTLTRLGGRGGTP